MAHTKEETVGQEELADSQQRQEEDSEEQSAEARIQVLLFAALSSIIWRIIGSSSAQGEGAAASRLHEERDSSAHRASRHRDGMEVHRVRTAERHSTATVASAHIPCRSGSGSVGDSWHRTSGADGNLQLALHEPSIDPSRPSLALVTRAVRPPP